MSNKVSRNSLRKRVARSIREVMIGEDNVSYWLARLDEVIDGFKEAKEEDGSPEVPDNLLVMKAIRRIEYEDSLAQRGKEAEKVNEKAAVKRVMRVCRLTLEHGVQPIVIAALILACLVIHGKLSMSAAIVAFSLNILAMFTTLLIMDVKYGAPDR